MNTHTDMPSWEYVVPNDQDVFFLRQLYLQAAIEGNIIRTVPEITPAYIREILFQSYNRGLQLACKLPDGSIIAEIHAITPEEHRFRHLLSNLTIVVLPQHQRKGIGYELFNTFLSKIKNEYSHILRVELYVRKQRHGVIKFYERLGFQKEGEFPHKILQRNGTLETPILMAWVNPNFQVTKLD